MKKQTYPEVIAIHPLHETKKLYKISLHLAGLTGVVEELFYSERDFDCRWKGREEANGEYKNLLTAVVCSENTPDNRGRLKYILENVVTMSITEQTFIPTIL